MKLLSGGNECLEDAEAEPGVLRRSSVSIEGIDVS